MIKHKFRVNLIYLIILFGLLLLGSCSRLESNSPPAATDQGSRLILPITQTTWSPKATRTFQLPIGPIATATPHPTTTIHPFSTAVFSLITPTLTPISFPAFLPNSEIIKHFNFEYLTASTLNQAVYRTEQGYIEIQDSAFWNHFQRKNSISFQEMQGVILKFKLEARGEARIFFETKLADDNILRWGIILANRPYTDVILVDTQIGENFLRGDIRIDPDHWYYLFLAIEPSANFSIIIYDSENIEAPLAYSQKLSTEWENRIWDFAIRGKSGKLYLEEFYIIQLEDSQQ